MSIEDSGDMEFAETPLEKYENKCVTTKDFNYLSSFPFTLTQM